MGGRLGGVYHQHIIYVIYNMNITNNNNKKRLLLRHCCSGENSVALTYRLKLQAALVINIQTEEDGIERLQSNCIKQQIWLQNKSF